jgi:hypothetical protein
MPTTTTQRGPSTQGYFEWSLDKRASAIQESDFGQAYEVSRAEAIDIDCLFQRYQDEAEYLETIRGQGGHAAQEKLSALLASYHRFNELLASALDDPYIDALFVEAWIGQDGEGEREHTMTHFKDAMHKFSHVGVAITEAQRYVPSGGLPVSHLPEVEPNRPKNVALDHLIQGLIRGVTATTTASCKAIGEAASSRREVMSAVSELLSLIGINVGFKSLQNRYPAK